MRGLIFLGPVLTLALATAGCARGPVVLGSKPRIEAAATAAVNVQSWWRQERTALPKPDSKARNARFDQQVQASLAQPCAGEPIALDRDQRALLEHIAGLLQQAPDTSLDGLGIGYVDGLPDSCKQLWTLTGRLGGGQPSWLTLTVVKVPDGDISSATLGRWAAVDSVSEAGAGALIQQLLDRVGAAAR
ncbi:MAG: hypothetical protein AAF736_11940 [Pseudomonadota bacterium]